MSSFLEVFSNVLLGVAFGCAMILIAMVATVLADKISTELGLVRDRWLINREMNNSPSWWEE